ncbi:MAG: LysR family transcriptional regulator [Rhizobiaceae bacterium]|nr:LysR family transcriptional regulator [Rhizobiaceae bacterium]
MKNITAIDLNLLVAFNALFLERNVTKAADRIGLAQPSMSNALSRLRALFNDELFVRTSGGMVPTPLAEKVANHIQIALSEAQSAVNIGREFDPKTISADISILVNDYVELVFLSPILNELRQSAPNIRIITRPVPPDRYGPSLEKGQVDFAIAAFPEPSPSMQYVELMSDFPVCICRKGHPILRQGMSTKRYVKCKYVSVSHSGDTYRRIDDALEKTMQKREASVTVSNFMTLPELITESELIAVVPNSLAKKMQMKNSIDIHKLPFDVPAFTLKLIWGRVVKQSALHMWFRDLVVEIVSKQTGMRNV